MEKSDPDHSSKSRILLKRQKKIKIFFFEFQETFNKVKANPPARIKRKAEKKRLEEEEAKRLRRADENQSAIDPTTGQFIPPNQPQPNPHQQSSTETTEVKNEVKSPEIKAESNGKMNGVKENGDNCDVEKDSNEKDENKLKIMLSGFVESEKEELTGLVQGLGMELTDIAQKATHLVMPKLGRTISFLCAISYVKYILKADWIRESSKEKKVLGTHFSGFCFLNFSYIFLYFCLFQM